ncbi:MAG: beta-galactosidase [Geminicoccales bacterium]
MHPDGSAFPAWCEAYLPYDPDDPNEFTGPMPRVPSGIFALGPTEAGFAVYASGDPTAPCDETRAPAANGKLLCPGAGPPNAPLQEILDSDAIVGVLLRFEWDEIETAPGVYDWSVLDTEVDRVAKAGKYYSLAFKAAKAGTPDWLFTDLGLSELRLQDGAVMAAVAVSRCHWETPRPLCTASATGCSSPQWRSICNRIPPGTERSRTSSRPAPI